MASKIQQQRRKKTPKVFLIYKYWAQKRLPFAKNDETIPLEEGTCFACGIFYHLQRCHIIPVSDNGPNTLENIHLLCISCHSRSENNKKYWNWLTYMRIHEWKFRWEWALKILQMNGVNINEEAEKLNDKDAKYKFLYIINLLKDNGIHIECENKN